MASKLLSLPTDGFGLYKRQVYARNSCIAAEFVMPHDPHQNVSGMLNSRQDTSARVFVMPGSGWTRFTYARADMELMGTVQFGMQVGALARLPSGDYAQVNGDFIEVLDADHVAMALRRAGVSEQGGAIEANRVSFAAPTVTIKKRRRIALPTD